MWAVQCNLDKIILFTSFLVVLIICAVLVSQPGENFSHWLEEKVRGGWQEAGAGDWQGTGAGGQANSSQLEEAGRRAASLILSDLQHTITTVTSSTSLQMRRVVMLI